MTNTCLQKQRIWRIVPILLLSLLLISGKAMAQERYVVSATKLNVKQTASAEAATIGNLSKGAEVDVYGFDGGWAEIRYGESTAFVAKKLIEKATMDELKLQNTLASNDLRQKDEHNANANANATVELSLKRKRRHTNDGYQWYEYVYEANVDGKTKTKTFRAAFDGNERQVTPIIEADNLSYTNGFFEMDTETGHALYDKQGNCIIPSSLGLNNIWIHLDEGTILAYDSKNEEQTRRAFTLDGKPCKDFPGSISHHQEASDEDNDEDGDDDEAEDLEDFYEHVMNGNEHLADCDYKAAIRSYKKALKHQKDAGVWYNLGVAQYNDGEYRRASKSFDEAYNMAKSQNGNSSLAKSALQMKRTCADLAKEKSQKAWGTVANIASIALAVTAAAVAETELQKLEMKQQKQQSMINSSNNRTTSSSYDDDDDDYYETESPKPKQQKKCGSCNGRGWNVEYTAAYGLDEKEYCSECGKTMMSSHYHKTCTRCNGTGYK